MSAGALFVMALIVVGAVIAVAIGIKKLLFICEPNEVLIFSGRRQRVAGRLVGYRSIKGGRRIKRPMVEAVDRLDLTNMAINVAVRGAFSKGGIPLNVEGVANVKIGGEEPLLGNAVERLLNKDRMAIEAIIKETLEGNLRGVLATLTPEEVNGDKIAFAQKLMEEADRDLHRLGLELDTLKIQNVSDERGYLDSIGRISGAEIRKQAVMAEADSTAEAAVRDANNVRDTELVRIDATIRTMEAEARKKITDAETQQAALVAESRGVTGAAVVEARAEVEVQKARIEQVRRQLDADVVTPARSRMQAQISEAKGRAANIVEQGKATAGVLEQITRVWKRAGENARDIFLLQKVQPLVETLTDTVESVSVDKLTVLGTGQGGDLAKNVISASEQLKAALGVDLVGALQQKLTTPAGKPTPPEIPIDV